MSSEYGQPESLTEDADDEDDDDDDDSSSSLEHRFESSSAPVRQIMEKKQDSDEVI